MRDNDKEQLPNLGVKDSCSARHPESERHRRHEVEARPAFGIPRLRGEGVWVHDLGGFEDPQGHTQRAGEPV